ncbi:MAG TPA: methyl-accepting chemotaxis protein [Acetobacteraceae bacterium]|jgi:methyl-accepting chemotaxis protein|nr:methyl-accepting chemotaxis protein [Acetobacteraceae bacterium]
MPFRLPATVGARTGAALLMLGAVALGGAGGTFAIMQAKSERIYALSRLADGPPAVERLRAGVYAVVMESRGIYIAEDRQAAERPARELQRHLAEMEGDWARLRGLLPPEAQQRAAALDGAVADFVRLRREIARVTLEQGQEAAQRLGNTEAIRASREVFSRALDELATLTRGVVNAVEEEAVKESQRLSLLLLVAISLAVVTTLGLALFATDRGVSRPLRRLAAALDEMAQGRLDVALPPAGDGEVGGIAAAAHVFLGKLRENRALEAAAATERAARDRRQAAMERHTQEFGASVSGVMAALGRAAASMRDGTQEMARAVERTREGAETTASGAESSARNLGAVAAAAEELTASVSEITRQVAQAAATAREAVGRAEATDATVRGLSEAAGQIGEVVRLISDIAGQTNLLALNATIEAARAGEAGKGFAVVASEVKQLAAQTAKATEQIGSQISAIQAATGQAVGAVQEVGEAIARMNEVASAIAAAVEQQGAATREISASVQTVARQTEEATAAMRDVTGAADAARTTSGTLLSVASDVAGTADQLRAEVDQFLAEMQTDEGERRRYERLAGNGLRATLRPRGGAEQEAEVKDIARGGIALLSGLVLDAGAEVEVVLPGAGGPVTGRVARCGGGTVAIAFRQDPAMLARIDRALDMLGGRAKAA